VDCNFRFLGQYFDEETQLHYNRHRYFSPETGQYISSDPIGLAGGFSPYSYVHNPAKWVDPYGLAGSVGNKGDAGVGKNNTRFLVDSKGQVLDLDYFGNIKFNGQIIKDGGRGGGKLPMMGDPNTYSKTSGGHAVVFGPDGRRIADISQERIKITEWHKTPNGQYFPKVGSDTKFADRHVPEEILKLLEPK
jgi:RHS repeat-associated protein